MTAHSQHPVHNLEALEYFMETLRIRPARRTVPSLPCEMLDASCRGESAAYLKKKDAFASYVDHGTRSGRSMYRMRYSRPAYIDCSYIWVRCDGFPRVLREKARVAIHSRTTIQDVVLFVWLLACITSITAQSRVKKSQEYSSTLVTWLDIIC